MPGQRETRCRVRDPISWVSWASARRRSRFSGVEIAWRASSRRRTRGARVVGGPRASASASSARATFARTPRTSRMCASLMSSRARSRHVLAGVGQCIRHHLDGVRVDDVLMGSCSVPRMRPPRTRRRRRRRLGRPRWRHAVAVTWPRARRPGQRLARSTSSSRRCCSRSPSSQSSSARRMQPDGVVVGASVDRRLRQRWSRTRWLRRVAGLGGLEPVVGEHQVVRRVDPFEASAIRRCSRRRRLPPSLVCQRGRTRAWENRNRSRRDLLDDARRHCVVEDVEHLVRAVPLTRRAPRRELPADERGDREQRFVGLVAKPVEALTHDLSHALGQPEIVDRALLVRPPIEPSEHARLGQWRSTSPRKNGLPSVSATSAHEARRCGRRPPPGRRRSRGTRGRRPRRSPDSVSRSTPDIVGSRRACVTSGCVRSRSVSAVGDDHQDPVVIVLSRNRCRSIAASASSPSGRRRPRAAPAAPSASSRTTRRRPRRTGGAARSRHRPQGRRCTWHRLAHPRRQSGQVAREPPGNNLGRVIEYQSSASANGWNGVPRSSSHWP